MQTARNTEVTSHVLTLHCAEHIQDKVVQFQQLLFFGGVGGGYEPEALNTKNIKGEEKEDRLRSAPWSVSLEPQQMEFRLKLQCAMHHFSQTARLAKYFLQV